MKLFCLQIIISFCGIFCCFSFQKVGINPIIASGLTGLLGSLMVKNKYLRNTNSDSLIYCASFAGIGILEVAPNFIFILVIAVFITLLFNQLKTHAIGYGGKLGTIAFVSSLIVWSASKWF